MYLCLVTKNIMTTKNINKIVFAIFLIISCSCSNEIQYSDSKDFSDGWKLDDPVTFNLNGIPKSKGSIYINIRNDNNYSFSNIYIIALLLKDDVEVFRDTLEYNMADKAGRFLGKGFGNVKESLLSWKENINFSTESNYSIVLKHAMRKNQNEYGMKVLPGIISVGISLVPNNKKND